jgi:dUTP pyrophosphatase
VNQPAEPAPLDLPDAGTAAPERPTVALTMLDAGIEPPRYAMPGDAGADLRTTEDVVLEPGARALVPTGVALALPEGFVGLVHPRSGLAVRHGLSLVNAPGTIDAGYRGEIKVPLLNTDRSEPIHLKRGDRVAQLVIQRVAQAVFVQVDELPGSDRGAAGFGSTGGFGPGDAGATA